MRTSDDTSKPTNGDSQPTTAEATSPEVDKQTEENKSDGNSPSPETASKADPAEDDKKPASLGDKREHDSSSAPTDKEKPAVSEPTTKKQKTDAKPAEDAAAADGNGEKKKGRPKKTQETKESAKRDVPTDGIGSRTRSRTKAT